MPRVKPAAAKKGSDYVQAAGATADRNRGRKPQFPLTLACRAHAVKPAQQITEDEDDTTQADARSPRHVVLERAMIALMHDGSSVVLGFVPPIPSSRQYVGITLIAWNQPNSSAPRREQAVSAQGDGCPIRRDGGK